jgi:hypothetical protein
MRTRSVAKRDISRILRLVGTVGNITKVAAFEEAMGMESYLEAARWTVSEL